MRTYLNMNKKIIACTDFDEFIENVEKEAKRSSEFIKNYWENIGKEQDHAHQDNK